MEIGFASLVQRRAKTASSSMRGTLKNYPFQHLAGEELPWDRTLLDRCVAVNTYADGLNPATLEEVATPNVGDEVTTSRLHPRGDHSAWPPGVDVGKDVLILGWQGDELYTFHHNGNVTPIAGGLDPQCIE